MNAKNCAVCNSLFVQKSRGRGRGRPRLYCSSICKSRAANGMRRPDLEVFDFAAINCRFCQRSFLPYSRNSKYCSASCRVQAYKTAASPKPIETLVCLCCRKSFVTSRANKRYCSSTCRVAQGSAIASSDYVDIGSRNSCPVYFRKCFDCGVDVCTRHPGRGLCDKCKDVRRSWTNTKKNAKRRAAGRIKVSRKQLLELRGNRCHICSKLIDLTLSGLHPKGFTVDHIFPVSKGGTNDVSNLHVAHRRCNMAKGNRGHAQLVMDEDAGPSTQAC
jgi:hypothetical protein